MGQLHKRQMMAFKIILMTTLTADKLNLGVDMIVCAYER